MKGTSRPLTIFLYAVILQAKANFVTMLRELEEELDTTTDELDKVCNELGKESEEQKVLQRERDDYELKIQDFEDARGALDASKHNFSDATKRYMESLADSDAVAMNRK